MSNDSGERIPEGARPDFSMPKVVDIQMRPTTHEPRRLRNFESTVRASDDAVEFIVKTESPIPIRALGPALYIGDTAVTEVEEIGENTYRFVAPAQRELAQDAAVHLGWTGQPPTTREATAFRFRL